MKTKKEVAVNNPLAAELSTEDYNVIILARVEKDETDGLRISKLASFYPQQGEDFDENEMAFTRKFTDGFVNKFAERLRVERFIQLLDEAGD